MRAWELIKETVFRKSHIPVIHVIWCVLYGLLGLLRVRDTLELGSLLFILSGCILPVLLSQGIFGDDIASGRIRVLLTKPMSFATPFIWKLVGMCLQCCVQLGIGSAILWTLHTVRGQGSIDNLVLFNGLSLLLFSSMAALSSTVSVLVKRGQNMLIVVLGAVLAVVVNKALGGSSDYLSLGVKGFIKYGLPPVGLLWAAGNGNPPLARILMLCAHSVGLVIIYTVIGVRILYRREFSCERDY